MKNLFAMAACMACVSALAANYNWSGSGAPNGNWSNPANWGGSVPGAGVPNLLTFSGTTQQASTNDLVGMTNAIVFANGGFRLDFSSQPNALATGAGITNLAGSNVLTGNLNLLSSSSSSAYFINVPAGTLNLNTILDGPTTAGGRKTGAGVLILSGYTPTSKGNLIIDSISTTADDGAVRVTSAAAVTNIGTFIIFNNGAGRSTLQLDGSAGGVDLDVRTPGQFRMSMNMRNGFAGTAPHIQNLAGTNSICGGDGGRFQVNIGSASPGTNVIFQSDAGLLVIRGTNGTGNLGKYNFVLSGAGNGVIAAGLADGSSSVTPTTASLIKVDGGTWTIDTNVFFTGNVTINGGTLAIGANGGAPNCASFIVASNATLDVTAVTGGWSLGAAQTLAGAGRVKGNVATTDNSFLQPGGANTAGTLTFSNNLVLSAATTNYFDLTASHAVGGTNDLITVLGNLTPNGAAIVINPLPSLTVGSYRLFNYTGTKTGTFGPVTFNGIVSGYIDESVSGQINLVVTSVVPPLNLRWTGGNGATWDVGGTANWSTNATPDINFFNPGDLVKFDDSSANTAVNITAGVSPGSVTVNITNAPYTISGAGMNVGTGGLTKNGPAMLTLDCSNTFNGPLRVNGGVLKLGPFFGGDALSTATSNIIASGATLDLNGWNVGTRPVYVSGTGVSGQGAIISSTYDSTDCGFHNVTFMGDTLVDTSGSIIRFFAFLSLGGASDAYVKGQGYKLTLQGTNRLYLDGFNVFTSAVQNPDFGDIEIRSGSELVAYYYTSLGRAASNCLVRAGGTLKFFGSGTNAAYKNLTLEGGSFWSSPSGTNVFFGPVLLTNGIANLSVGDTTSFLVNSAITGNGGLRTTNGGGTLTLAGANTYTGTTTVGSGTLLVNGSLASASAVTALGLSGVLGGNGTINGPVTIQPSGTLSPGTNAIGTLTINNNLTNAGNLLFELNKSNPQTNDYCFVSGVLTNSGAGTLTVSVTGASLVEGDRFQLFNKAVGNGGALAISPALALPLAWANNLAVDGSIQVVTQPPTLTAETADGYLYLSWQEPYLGWTLQVQTNNLNVGLGTNWVSIPGSDSSLGSGMPIDVNVPAVFFRLISP